MLRLSIDITDLGLHRPIIVVAPPFYGREGGILKEVTQGRRRSGETCTLLGEECSTLPSTPVTLRMVATTCVILRDRPELNHFRYRDTPCRKFPKLSLQLLDLVRFAFLCSVRVIPASRDWYRYSEWFQAGYCFQLRSLPPG